MQTLRAFATPDEDLTDRVRRALLIEHGGAPYGDGTGMWGPSFSRSAATVTRDLPFSIDTPADRVILAARLGGAIDMLASTATGEAAIVRQWLTSIRFVVLAESETTIAAYAKILKDASTSLRDYVTGEQHKARVDCAG